MKAAAKFRQLLKEEKGILVSPVVFDPLSARIAEQLGFKELTIGGYALGAHMTVAEPLMTMTELVEVSRKIAAAVNIPIRVDADGGFGEPLHTMRTVREFEAAGVGSIIIEDQAYPKRAHYHKAVEEVLPFEDYLVKLKAALRARQDPDFGIVARTDAMRHLGYDEGVRRANLCAEAGADLLLVWPNNLDEAKRAPRDIKAPVIYVSSQGNRFGRPYLTVQQAQDFGYRVVDYPMEVICAMALAVRDTLTKLRDNGDPGMDWEQCVAIRKDIERLIGLEEYYKIEEETVMAVLPGRSPSELERKV